LGSFHTLLVFTLGKARPCPQHSNYLQSEPLTKEKAWRLAWPPA
jgi:hypothetical protein